MKCPHWRELQANRVEISFKSPIKNTSSNLTDNLPHLGATAILFCCFTHLIGRVHLTDDLVFFFLLTSLDRCKQALKQQAEPRWMPLPVSLRRLFPSLYGNSRVLQSASPRRMRFAMETSGFRCQQRTAEAFIHSFIYLFYKNAYNHVPCKESSWEIIFQLFPRSKCETWAIEDASWFWWFENVWFLK